MNRIDLHCHTTLSDGLLSPPELVTEAAELQLSTIAITDHDTVEGITEGLEAGARLGVEVLPGVEINTDVPRGEVHILGYWFGDGWQDTQLEALLHRLATGRVARAQEMVRKLGELGAPISFERVQEIAIGEIIGRMHVAMALVEAGHVATPREAFDRYIERNGPAYAARFKLSPEDACRAIARTGGLPALAHPFSDIIDGEVPSQTLEQRVESLRDAGLKGLEVYYPGHTAVMMDLLLELTRRFALVPVGGSDYHGPLPGKAHLGSVQVPQRVLRRLKAVAAEPGGH